MIAIIEFIAAALPVYRASIDAGMWMLDQKAMGEYLESFLISKESM